MSFRNTFLGLTALVLAACGTPSGPSSGCATNEDCKNGRICNTDTSQCEFKPEDVLNIDTKQEDTYLAEEENTSESSVEEITHILPPKIYFVSDRNGYKNIFSMSPDGTNQEQITNYAGNEQQPAVSSDGTILFFAREIEKIPTIIALDLKTGQEQSYEKGFSVYNPNPVALDRIYVGAYPTDNSEILELISGTNLTNNPKGDWDPDYSIRWDKIVFISDRNGDPDLWIMGPGGEDPSLLFLGTGVNEYKPRWSPIEKKVVFETNWEGNSEVYAIQWEGENMVASNPVNLSLNPSNDNEPRYSPNGEEIVFRSDRDGNLEVYIMNADGTNQRNLTQSLGSDLEPFYWTKKK